MECTNCRVMMEKGSYTETIFLIGERNSVLRKKGLGQFLWFQSLNKLSRMEYLTKKLMGKVESQKSKGFDDIEFVDAWRCPKCGRIELYSTLENSPVET